MKKIVFLLLLTASFCFSQKTSKTIQGKITDGRNSIENVLVKVKSESEKTFTDEKGYYSTDASVGDVIEFSYQGLKTVRIKVEDVTRILNISMIPDVEELEEVVVKGSNRKSQRDLELEYHTNQNIIRTAYGFINGETAPGKIRYMGEDEINSVAICILDLLRNQFSGINVFGTCSGLSVPRNQSNVPSLAESTINPIAILNDPRSFSADANGAQSALNAGQVFIRGNNSLLNPRAAIFDVDGQIFTDAPLWIDIKNIKRLAILSNFATTTQYGSVGAGGVVVVNTISGIPASKEIYDKARLRNNFASNKSIITQDDLKRNNPNYLKELESSNTLETAKSVYQKYATSYSSSPYFFLDAQKYFVTRWNEKSFAEEIVDSHFSLFENNPVLLKALTYQYESMGDLEDANNLYKEVLRLRPTYLQSYRDIANSYRDIGKLQQAASIYTRYTYLINEGLLQKDSIDFDQLFEREYNNFLLLDKNAIVKGEKDKNLYVAEEDFEGTTRLVFEWNDSEAEFELQFVNPENQFYAWKHSLEANDELISNEKTFGYNTTEYLIDGSLPGNWKVNAKYLGNKSLTPTYLKATIYHNYGTYGQRKEVKVFKLMLKGANQELFTLPISAISITQ